MSDAGDVDVLEPETSCGVRVPVFVVGLIAVLAVVFLVGRALFFETGGASSPEEAVQDLAGAISQEDLAGALAALSPNEVGPIAETYQAGADKAKELGLTGEGGTFGFLDLEVEDLQLEVQELGPDIAKVVITDGTASGSFDPAKVGSKVKELGGSLGGDSVMTSDFYDEAVEEDEHADDSTIEPQSGEVTADELRAEIDGEEVDPFVAVVRQDEGWYVSPFYTVAEYLMLGADDEVPSPTYTKPELAPAASSPIAAVQQLVDAVNARDVGAGLDSLSAEEWAVLHTYRGAVEQVLEEAVGEIDPEAELQIDDIELTAKQISDERAVVLPKAFTAHVVTPETVDPEDEYSEGLSDLDGFEAFDELEEMEDVDELEFGTDEPAAPSGPTTMTIEFDGECLRWDDGTGSFDSCEMEDEVGSGLDLLPTFGLLGTMRGGGLDAEALDDVGIVVVAERGGWAISPMETLFGAMTTFIESIDAESFASMTGTQTSLPPQAKVAMGQSTEVTINDQGFAVVGVKAVEGETFELTVDDEDAMVGDLSDPDGEMPSSEIDGTDTGHQGVLSPEETGEYRAVILGRPGSTVTVTMEPYEVTTVELGESFDVKLSSGSPFDTVTLHLPESTYVAIEGDARLVLSGTDQEIFGRGGWVESGDVTLEVTTDGMEEHVDGTARIVELQPEEIDVSVTTDVSLAEGQVRLLRFTPAAGQTMPEVSEDLYVTTFLAGTGEMVFDTVLEEGEEYDLVVEPMDDTAEGTISFTAPRLGIDGDGPTAEFSWDPEMGEDGDWFELLLPAGQAATLSVAPAPALDVQLQLYCESDDTDLNADAGPAGAAETIAIEAASEVRTCEVYVVGQDVAGDYALDVTPA